MANRRVLVKRRKATQNIRKITRTMQLIATARFQAAYNRATASKPYTRKLAELVSNITRAAEDLEHPLMAEPEDVAREAMVVLTSDRGLCGGYNANILRAAVDHLDARAAKGIETEVTLVGKKGVSFFEFNERPFDDQIIGVGDKPRFDDAEPIANRLMDDYVHGRIAAVWVSYMRFVSTGRQEPVVERLLPLSYEAAEGDDDAGGVEYEFTPSPRQILDELLPATVRVRLFQAFTDAAVSEQVARMVAMKAATDAAQDMIKRLTREYNRARQTQVTMELLDIVGGANALG